LAAGYLALTITARTKVWRSLRNARRIVARLQPSPMRTAP